MKKTGKVLSLVLSLALVASSLVATTAGAATTPITETLAKLDDGTAINLVNGASGKASTTDITAKLDSTINQADTKDNLYASNLALDSVKVINGGNLITATYDKNNKTVKVDLNSANAAGTATIGVLYKATSYRYSNPNQPIDFIVEKDYPVVVHKLGAAEIKVTAPTEDQPKWKTSTESVTITGNVVVNERATASNTDRFLKTEDVTKEKISVPTSDVDAAKRATLEKGAADGSYFLTVSTTNNIDSKAADEGGTEKLTIAVDADKTEFTVTVSKPNGSETFNPGAVTLTATPVVKVGEADAALNRSKAVSDSSVKFTNTVDLTGSTYNKIATWHGATFASASATPWEDESSNGATANGKTVNRPAEESVEVTGSDVVLDDIADSFTTTMTNGNVGAVAVPAGNTFIVNDGSVGDIVGGKTETKASTVQIEEGRTGDVSAPNITVNGGTTGDLSGAAVAVNTNDSKYPATVGAITGSNVSVGSAQAAVTTGKVTLTGEEDPVESGHNHMGGTLTVSDSKTTIAGIDLTYYKSTIDAKGFVGTLPSPVNAEFGAVKTEASSSVDTTDLSFANAIAVDQLNVTNGTVTLAAGGTVNTVIGSGTVIAPAAKLTVKDSFNTVSLKLSDKDIKAGDVAFYAKPYAAATVSPVGFTVDYDAANAATDKVAVTAYKIKDVSFAGVTVQPQADYTNKIVQKTTSVYEGVAYPAGTQIPEGDTVQMSFTGNTDNFTTKISDNVISVTANKYDANFASQNKGTITATLVDKDGVADPKFAPATYDVTILEKAEAVPASFKIDSLPKNMKIGESYTVGVTASDASKAPFVGFASDFGLVTGTSYAGNKSFVTFTVKNVPGTHGLYVSGTKVGEITVDTQTVCDTLTVTKKAGQSYTFKVVERSVPNFGVAGVGTVKWTKAVKNSNGGWDLYYTVKATSAKGAHGVYINGVKVATYTFA